MKKKRITKEVADRVKKALKERVGSEQEGLFPPHLDIIRNESGLELAPGDEETYSSILESVCGATDDSQPVEQYDGSLGVPIAFVSANQAPVGQLQWRNNLASIYNNPGNVSGVRWCTGTLISNDLFLTAGHCFDQSGGGWNRPLDNTTSAVISPAEIATNMQVNFNYQVDPTGTLRTEQSFPILSLVEYRLGGLDFAIVRLGGSPGNIWGTTPISTTDATAGQMLCIIGHPAGWPKRIEAGPCLSVSGTDIRYDDIDTLGGNSGSGILRESDGRIVGVHTNGGCTPSSPGIGSNRGVRITSIIAESPTLQNLTSPKIKFFDDNVTLKFYDDRGGSLKFIDDGTSLKFIDDGSTLKFTDDSGSLKFIDDGSSIKFIDDSGSLKFIDDVKQSSLDKQYSDVKLPGSDIRPSGRFRGGFGNQGESISGQRPFILSTPHHSMAWAGGQKTQNSNQEMEAVRQYEQAITELAEVIEAGSSELTRLSKQYEVLVSEYKELIAHLNS